MPINVFFIEKSNEIIKAFSFIRQNIFFIIFVIFFMDVYINLKFLEIRYHNFNTCNVAAVQITSLFIFLYTVQIPMERSNDNRINKVSDESNQHN